ncbi:unnamed protein product [Thlaspi arvense]|uniref:40S ribosomal protein S6 n=1 Tax=Thlaspi arvense TaxID=13288 RepID=A0AAU9SCU8_THLAR|nr:unnamed protein product [Thlaspi arvense]
MGGPIKLNVIRDDGYFRDLDLLGPEGGDQRYCMPHMCSSYVPSLVQIKKPARGQKKEKKKKNKATQKKRRLQKRVSEVNLHEETKGENDKTGLFQAAI